MGSHRKRFDERRLVERDVADRMDEPLLHHDGLGEATAAPGDADEADEAEAVVQARLACGARAAHDERFHGDSLTHREPCDDLRDLRDLRDRARELVPEDHRKRLPGVWMRMPSGRARRHRAPGPTGGQAHRTAGTPVRTAKQRSSTAELRSRYLI